jgi:hypothetical protein
MARPGLASIIVVLACGCATPSPQVVSRLGRPLVPRTPTPQFEADLHQARVEHAARPDDPSTSVWVGRRLGYLWLMNEAIDTYTQPISHDDSTYIFSVMRLTRIVA